MSSIDEEVRSPKKLNDLPEVKVTLVNQVNPGACGLLPWVSSAPGSGFSSAFVGPALPRLST